MGKGKGVNGNLIPGNQRSHEDNVKNGRKGGIASGEAKARKRETKLIVRELLAAPVKVPAKAKTALAKLGLDGETPTVELLGLIAIANQAMAGDLDAARFLYDYGHVPDLRASLDRERINAAKGSAPDSTALKHAREILGGVDSVID